MKNLSAFFPALRPEFNDIVSFCDDSTPCSMTTTVLLSSSDGEAVNEFSSVGRVEPMVGSSRTQRLGFDRPVPLALVDAVAVRRQ